MNTFTRKTLYAAIAGAATIGVAGSAQAVNVSADGLGQVLIYPYYTVQPNPAGQAWNTLMSVVNTTASVKAVKVRFREGRNSVEVLDFNVFLSPFDVWTASITPAPAVSGTKWGAQVSTTDNSCTIPSFTPGVGVPFRTSGLEAGDNDASRTAEGYIEIFEMSTEVGTTAASATHNPATNKPACGLTDTQAAIDARAPGGGLFGGVILVNPAGGGMFSQAATALANFNPNALYRTTGSQSPQYSDAVPTVSNVIQGSTLYRSTWAGGDDAVTAVLLGNAVTNEFVLDTASKSQTSWVITMPSKYAYVSFTGATRPFTNKYISKTGACEPTFPIVFNREEARPEIVQLNDFSPIPPTAPGPVICWEANVVQFSNSSPAPAANNFFGSANLSTLTTAFQNGWSTFGFNDPTVAAVHSMTPIATTAFDLTAGTTAGVAVTYFGLPVIGFAAETYNNNALIVGGVSYLATFGASFVHHKTTRIQ